MAEDDGDGSPVVVGYAGLIVILRITGKRTLAKMNAFDLVVTVSLGSVLAAAVLDENVSLAEAIAAFVVLVNVVLYRVLLPTTPDHDRLHGLIPIVAASLRLHWTMLGSDSRPVASPDPDEVFRTALAKEPDDRYADVPAFVAALTAVAAVTLSLLTGAHRFIWQ